MAAQAPSSLTQSIKNSFYNEYIKNYQPSNPKGESYFETIKTILDDGFIPTFNACAFSPVILPIKFFGLHISNISQSTYISKATNKCIRIIKWISITPYLLILFIKQVITIPFLYAINLLTVIIAKPIYSVYTLYKKK